MDELDRLILELIKKFSNQGDFIKKERRFVFRCGNRLSCFSYFQRTIKMFEKALYYHFKYEDKEGKRLS